MTQITNSGSNPISGSIPAAAIESIASALPPLPTLPSISLPELTGEVDPPAPTNTALPHHRASAKVRYMNLLAVILPFAAFAFAVWSLWGIAVDWLYISLFLGMYLVSGLGITIGFHRYFTHKSFETTKVGKWILGAAGSMAVEGPLVDWVAWHRQHHRHSDESDDPHSPHADHGEDLKGIIKGFYHAHMGWMIKMGEPERMRYAPDIVRDPMLLSISRNFRWFMLAGLVIPAFIAMAVVWISTGSFTSALAAYGLGLVWGGLARVCFVHHVTWSVNSICHVWGSKTYESHDESRNNPIVGVLAFGEGWHNNHHAFPTSARHGLAWWQFDLSYVIIKGLSFLGLTWDVKVPDAERRQAKLKKTAA